MRSAPGSAGRNAAGPQRRQRHTARGRLRAAAARPAPEASASPATSGRDTRLPAAGVIDFAALPRRRTPPWPGCCWPSRNLVALDLPALAAAAGYPGTKAISATAYLLSLLTLKLTASRAGVPRR